MHYNLPMESTAVWFEKRGPRVSIKNADHNVPFVFLNVNIDFSIIPPFFSVLFFFSKESLHFDCRKLLN